MTPIKHKYASQNNLANRIFNFGRIKSILA